MKIKIAILEQDAGYLSRITNVFNVRYADKLEVYSFTTYEGAMEALDTKRIDVLLADDSFEIDEESLPRRCGFAFWNLQIATQSLTLSIPAESTR